MLLIWQWDGSWDWGWLEFWEWVGSGNDSGSTTVRNIGLVLAGIGVLIFAMRRSIVSGRRAESAQQQSETGRRALLNDRHERAVELLANRVLAVRLGGIEALRRLAEEDPQHYHLPVVNQFCAFVRHPTPDPDLIQTFVLDSSQGMGVPIVRDDVQHALVAVGRRSEAGIQLEQTTGVRLDLRMADIQKLLLTDSNLNGVIFEGANLSYPRLYGVDFSNADFRYANLQSTFFPRASFKDAMFDSADLSH